MKIFKQNFCLTLCLCALLCFACTKDEENIVPLEITKISNIIDREQSIDQAELTQYIIVQGKGFEPVNCILVNDVVVDMDELYKTSNELIFPIPRALPDEVTNTLTVITPQQQVSAPLTINIPKLKINGMYNEYAPEGSMMRIVGDYFDLYGITVEEGKIIWGTEEIKIEKAVQDTLYFKIPVNAQANTKIKVYSPVEGEVAVPGRYKEKGNSLVDFENYSGWGGGQYIIDGPEPESISGKFSRFKISAADAGDWEWSGTTAIIQTGGLVYSEDILTNPQNYQFKFEVNSFLPLTKRYFRFYFEGANEFRWPAADGFPFSTNKEWRTLTFELTDVWTEGIVPTGTMWQVMANTPAEDTDICFDNFRIVPKE